METSNLQVYKRAREMKRRAESGSRDQGVAFQRLMDSLLLAFAEEIAELREEHRVLESKIDKHIATLRSDLSKIRQAVRSKEDSA